MAQTLPNRNVMSQSDVTLYRNVPFSYDYTNTRWFNNAVEQTTYFNKFEYTKRLNVQIVKLFNDSYINIRDYTDDLFECNYLSFKNENGKLMFAHIINFETKNKSVVSVYFEIDPIQTYMFDMQFKQSFINREHENADQGMNINPEGLNIGKEYVITKEIPIRPFDFYFFVVCTKYPLSESTRNWNNTNPEDENNNGSIEKALEWMYQQHLRTDTYYSMTDRLGPNSYDCSSAVFFALQNAGITTQMGNTDTLFSLEGSLLTPISESEVRRGDLWVSGEKSGSANEYGHTGFAWSTTEAIHCSSQFADGFGITPLTANYIAAYEGAPIYWYRVNAPSSTPSPTPTEETVDPTDPDALTILSNIDSFRPAWAGTVDSLYYYFLPIPYGNTGSLVMKADGTEGYSVSKNTIKEVVKWLQVSTIAVNNVVSMFVTEYLPIKVASTTYGENYNTYQMTGGQCQFYYLPDEKRLESKAGDIGLFQITNLYGEFDEKMVKIPLSDLGLNDPESKLDTAPYCLIELSDGRGNIKTYNPELVKIMGDDIYLTFKGSLMPSNYWSVGLSGYAGAFENGGLHANSLISSDPQDVTVLDDKSAAYLQGHKNTINAQNQVWEQQRNYARRSAGIQMATQGSNMLVNGLQAGIGAVMSGGSSLLFGNDIQNTINNAGGLAQASNNYYQAGKDYENNVAMQMATIEDINNLPPSITKQGKSASYTFGNQLYGVRLTVKRIQPFYRDLVRNYFKAFGYKSNRFKVPNIRTRTNWNYVKLSMANITGNIPQNMLTTIDSIFEKGITLWHTDSMYRYDLPNDEREV